MLQLCLLYSKLNCIYILWKQRFSISYPSPVSTVAGFLLYSIRCANSHVSKSFAHCNINELLTKYYYYIIIIIDFVNITISLIEEIFGFKFTVRIRVLSLLPSQLISWCDLLRVSASTRHHGMTLLAWFVKVLLKSLLLHSFQTSDHWDHLLT